MARKCSLKQCKADRALDSRYCPEHRDLYEPSKDTYTLTIVATNTGAAVDLEAK